MRSCTILVLVAVLAAGCQPGSPPAAGGGTPPSTAAAAPPAPETSLGRLTHVERVKKATLLVRCIKDASDQMMGVVTKPLPPDAIAVKTREGHDVYTAKPNAGVEVLAIVDKVGVCPLEEPAAEGREYVVATFEGAAKRGVNQEGTMARFVPAGAAGVLSRSDHQSLLRTAQEASPGLVISEGEAKRQLAFEVAAGARDLVWEDAEARYQLEPHPVALPAAVKAK